MRYINTPDKTKTKIVLFTIILILIITVLSLLNKSYWDNSINYQALDSKTKTKILSENHIEKINDELNILFVGDIMTDRYIRKQINKFRSVDTNISEAENFKNNYLNNLSELNSNYDYVVANLEGPITSNKSLTLNDDGTYSADLLFTFPSSTAEILKLLNIKAVSLANNHTDNFYHKGLQDAKNFLDSDSVKYFGNPYNNKEDKLSEIICEKDICIAYVGYNKFTSNNNSKIIENEIKRINENIETVSADFIVIMPHWGEEYDMQANETEKRYARSWIDAGADHVIQDNELYNDKHIYYSLGNYIFDQWFTPEVKRGLALPVTFTKTCTTGEMVSKNKQCEKNIKINQDLDVSIDRNGVRYIENNI
jgi:gamma-polyglutamate biosynthesis protein CapA